MFKVGDVVRCINSDNYIYISVGSTYKVLMVGEISSIRIKCNDGNFRYYPFSCFEHLPDNKRLNELQEALEIVRRVKEGYEKEGYIVKINNFNLEKIERTVVKTSVETLYP